MACRSARRSWTLRRRLAGDRGQFVPARNLRGVPSGHRRADERAAQPSGPAWHLGGLCPAEGAAVRAPARRRCRADAAGVARTLPGMVGRPRPVEDLRRGSRMRISYIRPGRITEARRGRNRPRRILFQQRGARAQRGRAVRRGAGGGRPPERSCSRSCAASQPLPHRAQPVGEFRRRALRGRFQGDQPVGDDRLDPHAGPPGLADRRAAVPRKRIFRRRFRS